MNVVYFRFWNKKTKKMLKFGEDIVSMYSNGTVRTPARWDGNRTVSGDIISTQDLVLMLSIGVCDAKGRQIFECDIVKTESGGHIAVKPVDKINDHDRWVYGRSRVVSNTFREEGKNGRK